jgi:hypothetical protein
LAALGTFAKRISTLPKSALGWKLLAIFSVRSYPPPTWRSLKLPCSFAASAGVKSRRTQRSAPPEDEELRLDKDERLLLEEDERLLLGEDEEPLLDEDVALLLDWVEEPLLDRDGDPLLDWDEEAPLD